MSFRGIAAAATFALAAFGAAVQARTGGGGSDPALFGAGVAAWAACAWAAGGGRPEKFLSGRFAWIAWGAGAALMAALLVAGRRYRGGLYLPGLLNPSEAVKFCLAACAAGWLGAGRKGLMAGCGALVGMVALARDFGMAAQLAATVAAMLFAASWLKGALAFAGIAGAFWAASHAGAGHLAVRFSVWRDPLADMTGGGWQTLQGLAAVAGGGLWGAGFRMGNVEGVPIAESDFVYAAVAADFGLAGCAAVLAAWCAVLACGFRAAAKRAAAGEKCSAVFAAGLASSLGVQLILNVAGVLNALPMTGITLPLVSKGGASYCVTMAMCGTLFGLAGGGAPASRTPSGQTRPSRRKSPPSRQDP